MYIRDIPPLLKTIIPEFAPSTNTGAAGTRVFGEVELGGTGYARVQCTTGTIYISTLTTAPTTTNGWKLDDNDQPLNLCYTENIALYSTSTGSMAQILGLEI
jgi:hypothetical protein